jgi:hypothetical protein
MLDEKDEIELLKFWLADFENIGKIPNHLKSKISEDDITNLLTILPHENLLKEINDRLEKLQSKILKKEEIDLQKKSYSFRYMWKNFLLFGIFIIVINTAISAIVTFKINDLLEGPACRIETTGNIFSWNKSTGFSLSFVVVNLRNQKVLFNGAKANCYWAPIQEHTNISEPSNITASIPITPPGAPPAPTNIEELGGFSTTIPGCRSPQFAGNYVITIIASLSSGTCSKGITMIVK